jgi:glc operon protein GlcG
MRLKPSLTSEDVIKMVAAAKREASRHGLLATIAVVDQGGDLLYLERPDTHSPNAVEMAAGKARTAAFRERPSSALEERVKERPGFLMTPNQIGVRGGVPLFYKGECVGGIGVSGIGNHDEPTAQAGADALEA